MLSLPYRTDGIRSVRASMGRTSSTTVRCAVWGLTRVQNLEEHPMSQAWRSESITEPEESADKEDTTHYLDVIAGLDSIRTNANATAEHCRLARSLSKDITNARDYYAVASTRIKHLDDVVFTLTEGHYGLLKIVHDIDIRMAMPSEYEQEVMADIRCVSMHLIVRSYQSLVSDCDHKFTDIIIEDGIVNECTEENCYATLEDKLLGIADASILSNGCTYLIELHCRNSMMEERIQVSHQKLSSCLTYIRTGLVRLTT